VMDIGGPARPAMSADRQAGGAKVGLMICFDWIFPEACRSLALKGADIICHPSNLILPYCQTAMTTRAMENGLFTITANRIGSERRNGQELTFTGGSQIVDPRGRVLAQASRDQEEVVVVEIDPIQARDKNFTASNHLFRDRRVDLYEFATNPVTPEHSCRGQGR